MIMPLARRRLWQSRPRIDHPERRSFSLPLLLSFSTASAAEVERVTRGNLAIEGIPEIPRMIS